MTAKEIGEEQLYIPKVSVIAFANEPMRNNLNEQRSWVSNSNDKIYLFDLEPRLQVADQIINAHLQDW